MNSQCTVRERCGDIAGERGIVAALIDAYLDTLVVCGKDPVPGGPVLQVIGLPPEHRMAEARPLDKPYAATGQGHVPDNGRPFTAREHREGVEGVEDR